MDIPFSWAPASSPSWDDPGQQRTRPFPGRSGGWNRFRCSRAGQVWICSFGRVPMVRGFCAPYLQWLGSGNGRPAPARVQHWPDRSTRCRARWRRSCPRERFFVVPHAVGAPLSARSRPPGERNPTSTHGALTPAAAGWLKSAAGRVGGRRSLPDLLRRGSLSGSTATGASLRHFPEQGRHGGHPQGNGLRHDGGHGPHGWVSRHEALVGPCTDDAAARHYECQTDSGKPP